jgi:hypothetical protein
LSGSFPGIDFGLGVKWVAASQPTMTLWSRNPGLGLRERVLFAAMGRVDPTGHAPFGVGELASQLGAKDGSVSKAIRQAKEAGLIHADSQARCIILPGYAFQRGKGQQVSCPHDRRQA